MATAEPYMPIHVGKALGNVDLGITGDDTGTEISEKNQSYNELTGMYWAWKNLKDVDIIGLCHYRRYFDFHGRVSRFRECGVVPTSDFAKLDLSVPDKIINRIKDGTAVVANRRYYIIDMYHDYCFCHISDDIRTLSRVIKELTPQYWPSFNKTMWESNSMSHYNMFIMTWHDFDRYCSWLFSILAEVERRIDISHYNNWQRRIYGFMGERLLNVYVHAQHMKLIHRPVMLIRDGVSTDSALNMLQKRIRGYCAVKFFSRRLDSNYDN